MIPNLGPGKAYPASPTPRRIDHLGIACRSVEKTEALYHGVLGFRVLSREIHEAMKLRIVKITTGDVVLELLEPLPGEQVVSKFIEQRGEGIHHLCFEVDDVGLATTHLRGEGYAPFWDEPRVGAGGRRVNFLRPRETFGVLLELSERPPLE